MQTSATMQGYCLLVCLFRDTCINGDSETEQRYLDCAKHHRQLQRDPSEPGQFVRTGGQEDGLGGDVTVRRPGRGRHGGEEALPAGVPATAGLRGM